MINEEKRYNNKSTIIPLRMIMPITSIGTFMSAMDGSIVNVSLVTIKDALTTDMDGVRWIVIVYLLTISALIGIGGVLGDNYGRKKVFQLGMGLFVFGSIFCAFSTSLELLVVSRIIQAIGGAGLMANGLALVITYIEPSIRGRAIGLNSLVVASALSVGPALGGFLSEFVGWPSIFLINIPIGLLGIVLVQRFIPETSKKTIHQLDYLGMILFIITAFSFVIGILSIFEMDIFGIVFLVFSLLAAIIFIITETRHSEPMISVHIIKDRTILTGIISSLLCYMVYYAVTFLLPFYYQEVLLFSQSVTGILMIVAPIVMAITGPIGGLMAERIEAKKLASFGAALLGLFVLLLALSIDESLFIVILLVALCSGSLTIFTSSNGTSVMNASPETDVSVVSGLIGLSRNIGFALGTTISSAFFGLFFSLYNPDNFTSGNVFTKSYYLSLESTYFIFALFAILGALISFLRMHEKRKIGITEN